MGQIDKRLAELGTTLPGAAKPAANYVPGVRTGNLVFISGHIAKQDGKAWVGQLGLTMGTAEGQAAARAIALRMPSRMACTCSRKACSLVSGRSRMLIRATWFVTPFGRSRSDSG